MKVAWRSDHIKTWIFATCETEFGGALRSQFHGREAHKPASPRQVTEEQVITNNYTNE